MSIFANIESGLTNAEKFLLKIVTGGKALATVWSTMGPGIVGAAQAVFYDVTKSVAAGLGAAGAAEAGNVPLTITLSETTITLVKQLVVDFKAGEADVVAAFKALNINI